jgi:hypothetical protein
VWDWGRTSGKRSKTQEKRERSQRRVHRQKREGAIVRERKLKNKTRA